MDHEQTSHPHIIQSPGGGNPGTQPDHGTQAMTSTTGYNSGGSSHYESTAGRGFAETHSTSGPPIDVPNVPPRSRHSQGGHTLPASNHPIDHSRSVNESATVAPPNHPPTGQSGAGGDKEAQTEKKDRTCLHWLLLCCCKRNRKDKISEPFRNMNKKGAQMEKDKIAEPKPIPGTIGYRLAPTIKCADEEREKCARKALLLGWAVNIAIGLQVLLGALTTALAAAVTSTKQAQVSTAVLGGLATLVASYLARVRGSGEPELSVMRVKDLEHFLRDCRVFELDSGNETCADNRHGHLNRHLMDLRQKLENLLGNANGERKLSATGIATAETPGTSAGTSHPTNR